MQAQILVWLLSTSLPVETLGLVSSSLPIQYRAGTAADTLPIAWQLGRELMNPLGVQGNRFIVACNNDYNDRLGWAQIRPLGGRREAMERETDDVMWDEFEANDTVQVPVGWQSLPWTRQYRDFAAAAAARRDRNTIQQEVQNEMPVLYELASVWVHPSYRGQGIGTQLVQRVLQRHVTCGVGPLENVYLLTLQTTTAWYRDNFGFAVVPGPYVPDAMAFEVQAGQVITALLGAQLVCMQGNTEAFLETCRRKDKDKSSRQESPKKL